MTTLTTRAGFDAFRDRMCDHFGQLPDGLGNQHLHVEQAPLGPDEYFTHRLDGDGHYVVYDPRQTSGLMVRQFLGIYATFTEEPTREGVRGPTTRRKRRACGKSGQSSSARSTAPRTPRA